MTVMPRIVWYPIPLALLLLDRIRRVLWRWRPMGELAVSSGIRPYISQRESVCFCVLSQ